MIYSRTSEYAIRALVYFANYPEKTYATVKDVSRASGVPRAYVAKIFQGLVKSGILRAVRGPHGGYALTSRPDALILLRVVKALDDLSGSLFKNCVMGFDKCNDRNPCPLHPVWKKAKEAMLEELRTCTIADVAKLNGRFKTGKRSRAVLSNHMRDLFQ